MQAAARNESSMILCTTPKCDFNVVFLVKTFSQIWHRNCFLWPHSYLTWNFQLPKVEYDLLQFLGQKYRCGTPVENSIKENNSLL